MVAHASVASCKPKVEIDSHADMSLVTIAESFITIIDQLMSTVFIKKMATEVPRQLMPQ